MILSAALIDMWPYWVLFLWPTFASLAPQRLTRRDQLIFWWLTAIFFSVMIGLRHDVGGDWITYVGNMQHVASIDFIDALKFKDPGYYGLNWIVAHLGGDIYAVNLVCAFIVVLGVVRFCRQQPRPWLALTAAVPYLIVVVAMGYTRQGAALGFALVALTALDRQKLVQFVVWILLGALFHKSAVLLLPVAALASSRNKLWTWFWVGVVSATGAFLLVGSEGSETLWNSYVVAGYESEGGPIRVAMNGVPAVLLLVFRNKLVTDPARRKLWSWMSILALACVPLVFISSTAVDRVALYFIPIQMYVFSRLPLLAKTSFGRTMLLLGVIVYYAAVLWVWLTFASHATAWLPYQFMPF